VRRGRLRRGRSRRYAGGAGDPTQGDCAAHPGQHHAVKNDKAFHKHKHIVLRAG